MFGNQMYGMNMYGQAAQIHMFGNVPGIFMAPSHAAISACMQQNAGAHDASMQQNAGAHDASMQQNEGAHNASMQQNGAHDVSMQQNAGAHDASMQQNEGAGAHYAPTSQDNHAGVSCDDPVVLTAPPQQATSAPMHSNDGINIGHLQQSSSSNHGDIHTQRNDDTDHNVVNNHAPWPHGNAARSASQVPQQPMMTMAGSEHTSGAHCSDIRSGSAVNNALQQQAPPPVSMMSANNGVDQQINANNNNDINNNIGANNAAIHGASNAPLLHAAANRPMMISMSAFQSMIPPEVRQNPDFMRAMNVQMQWWNSVTVGQNHAASPQLQSDGAENNSGDENGGKKRNEGDGEGAESSSCGEEDILKSQRKKRSSSYQWLGTWTIENPTEQELESLRTAVDRGVAKYMVFCHAVNAGDGTPRIEGFAISPKKMSVKNWRKVLGNRFTLPEGFTGVRDMDETIARCKGLDREPAGEKLPWKRQRYNYMKWDGAGECEEYGKYEKPVKKRYPWKGAGKFKAATKAEGRELEDSESESDASSNEDVSPLPEARAEPRPKRKHRTPLRLVAQADIEMQPQTQRAAKKQRETQTGKTVSDVPQRQTQTQEAGDPDRTGQIDMDGESDHDDNDDNDESMMADGESNLELLAQLSSAMQRESNA
jgi:hypothetical protein